MSASSGVLRETASKSSIVSFTPASRATASRWSTAFVEPPVAMTPAIALWIDLRVMIRRGSRPLRSTSMTSRPVWYAISSLCGSGAGTPLKPIGEMPSISNAVAIVLAVNCPPHAPSPGQAAHSTALSSAASILPALCAPIASKTSWIVSRRPLYSPN